MHHRIFENPRLLKIWIWCLLKARHEGGEAIVGRQKIHLNRGQFLFGRNKAAQELDLSPTSVWDYMKFLEFDNSIVIKSTTKYSIVTIINWDFYQEKSTSEPTTKSAEKDTYKNVNTIAHNASPRSEHIKPLQGAIVFSFESRQWEGISPQDKQAWVAAYPACDVDLELLKMGQWLLANPQKRKKNYRRFITNWLNRTQDSGGTRKEKARQDSYDLSLQELKK